jgi:hypothetical protein
MLLLPQRILYVHNWKILKTSVVREKVLIKKTNLTKQSLKQRIFGLLSIEKELSSGWCRFHMTNFLLAALHVYFEKIFINVLLLTIYLQHPQCDPSLLWTNLTFDLWVYHLKGIVQRILIGVNIKHKQSVLVNWRPGHFFFMNFKGTPSQEEHKTIFSGSKINKMTLSD